MRIFPSTRTHRCIKIVVTSLYVNAYFNRLRRMRHSGRHSRCLCGPTCTARAPAWSVSTSQNSLHARVAIIIHTPSSPSIAARAERAARDPKTLATPAWSHAPGEGLGANTPPSLSSIQCLGAFKRFMCFFGPRGMMRGVRAARASRRDGSRRRARGRDRPTLVLARARRPSEPLDTAKTGPMEPPSLVHPVSNRPFERVRRSSDPATILRRAFMAFDARRIRVSSDPSDDRESRANRSRARPTAAGDATRRVDARRIRAR